MSVSSPINPVVDHLADLALWEAELAGDPRQTASTLMARLALVPNPRDLRGRRRPLVVILMLTACAALIVGKHCLAAIWQWAAGTDQEVWLASVPVMTDGPAGIWCPARLLSAAIGPPRR